MPPHLQPSKSPHSLSALTKPNWPTNVEESSELFEEGRYSSQVRVLDLLSGTETVAWRGNWTYPAPTRLVWDSQGNTVRFFKGKENIDAGPSCSPNARWVLYGDRKNGSTLVELHSGSTYRLDPDRLQQSVWAPDSERLAYLCDSGDPNRWPRWHWLDVSTRISGSFGGQRNLAEQRAEWNPDSTRLLIEGVDPESEKRKSRLFVGKTNGGLFEMPGLTEVHWALGGTRLVGLDQELGRCFQNLVILDRNGFYRTTYVIRSAGH